MYDDHPYAAKKTAPSRNGGGDGLRKKYRPSSAGGRRSRSRSRRPLSARQERPMTAKEMRRGGGGGGGGRAERDRRLSPVASFRNANNDEVDYEDEEFGKFADEMAYVVESGDSYGEELEYAVSGRRKKRKGRRNRGNRPSTAGRVRKRRSTAGRRGAADGAADSILRGSKRGGGGGSSHGNLETMHRRGNSNNSSGETGGGSDASALARSEDLLARARQYLLNRAGYLNSNTRRFLDDDPADTVQQDRRAAPRFVGTSSTKRQRPQSARPQSSSSQYTSDRETDFRAGAGRMAAASRGELSGSPIRTTVVRPSTAAMSSSPHRRGGGGRRGGRGGRGGGGRRRGGRRRGGGRRGGEGEQHGELEDEEDNDAQNFNDTRRWDQNWDGYGLNGLETDVRTTLMNISGVVELSRLRVTKIQEGSEEKGVNVDVHISVDASTSVLRAHEIASQARAAVFAVDTCIEDATVHVDAQPTTSLHGGEEALSASGKFSSGRRISPSTERLKRAVKEALRQIRDIYRISKIKIKTRMKSPGSSSRSSSPGSPNQKRIVCAEVEILVNPELKIRRVHAVARSARELIEAVPGIDEADVHLELDEGGVDDEEEVGRGMSSAGSMAGSIAGSIAAISDGTVRSGGEDDDEDEMYDDDFDQDAGESRGRGSSNSGGDGGSGSLRSSHPHQVGLTSSMLKPETDSQATASTRQNTERSDLSSSMEETLPSYATAAATAASSPLVHQRRRDHQKKQQSSSPSHSPLLSSTPTKLTTTRSKPVSSQKLKRKQRIIKLTTEDSNIRNSLIRMNQHLMQSVLYKKFKYEKRLIAIGTEMADVDVEGRGLLSTTDMMHILSEQDVGLQDDEDILDFAQRVSRLTRRGDGTVRYSDVMDALRTLQKEEEDGEEDGGGEEGYHHGESSQEASSSAVGSGRLLTYQNDDEDGGEEGEEGEEEQNSITRNQREERRKKHEKKMEEALREQHNRAAVVVARSTAMAPPMTPEQKLTSAEAARKEMERKLSELKSAQEGELAAIREELEIQKLKMLEERKELDLARKEHEQAMEEERVAAEARKTKDVEREQRDALKREWLAREAAQQKRLAVEKTKREKEDLIKEASLKLEASKVQQESERLKVEKEKWIEKQKYEEERRKDQQERERVERQMTVEKDRRQVLAEKLKVQEEALRVKEKEWRLQREMGVERENELNQLKRQMDEERREAQMKMEDEMRRREKEIESTLLSKRVELDRVMAERKKIEEEAITKVKSTEATYLAKIREVELMKEAEVRKTKEEAENSVDRLKVEHEMELQRKMLEMTEKMQEMELKIVGEQKKREENALLEVKELEKKVQKEREEEKEEKEKIKLQHEEDKLKLQKEMEELAAKLKEEARKAAEAVVLAEKEKAAAIVASKEKEEKDKEFKKKEIEKLEMERKETERLSKLAVKKAEKEAAARVEAAEKKASVEKEAAEEARRLAEEAHKLKEEAERRALQAHGEARERGIALELTPVTQHEVKPSMLFDPKDPMEIPQWSQIFDPSTRKYYYQNNFNGATQWEIPTREVGDDEESTTNNHISPLKQKTPIKTKSVTLNQNVAVLRMQCCFRAFVARRVVRNKRGELHAALRPDEAAEYERWMEMTESMMVGGKIYWYDTLQHTSSWSKPSKEETDKYIAEQEERIALKKGKEGKENEMENEMGAVLSKSMSLRERRAAGKIQKNEKESLINGSGSVHSSPVKKNKLKRKLSIDTDTALQPQGVVTPYESPENAFSEAKDHPTALVEDAEDGTLQMTMMSTDRSMGGGATERELAGGDTFPDLDVALPSMMSSSHTQQQQQQQHMQQQQHAHSQSGIRGGDAAVAGGGQTWEALTTPMGKHMYWYNWSSGDSQWEKPAEVQNLTDSQIGHRVMPSTPKGGGSGGRGGSAAVVDKATELWKSLRERSKVTRQWSDWKEFQDERTEEFFYFSHSEQRYQWEKPAGWNPTGGMGSGGGQHSVATGGRGHGWQMVTTPLGRSLYYINDATGASQWDRPAEMDSEERLKKKSSSSGGGGGEQAAAMKLASTPKATDKDHAGKLWLVLARRSTRVQVIGDWHEFYDPMTKETFYHNSKLDEYRWEVPTEFIQNNDHIISPASAGSEMEPVIQPTIHSIPKAHQPVQVWEPVATPKGKHLYYWNK